MESATHMSIHGCTEENNQNLKRHLHSTSSPPGRSCSVIMVGTRITTRLDTCLLQIITQLTTCSSESQHKPPHPDRNMARPKHKKIGT